jgi:threonine synthase
MICLDCSREETGRDVMTCPACGGSFAFRYDLAGLRWDDTMPGIWRFRRLLPLPPGAEPVSLDEGGTPLLKSRLDLGIDLRWKDETRNPTGSHKDRQLAVAVTHARAIGARRSVVVSAGSTGLSNAAYAARAGLGSVTLMSSGTPAERILPLTAYGSRLIEVASDIDTIIAAARHLAGHGGTYVSSTTRSTNPYQAEGAKTVAFEIVGQLGEAPDWVVVPVGGGGTIGALWRGFVEMRDAGLATRLPRLAAVVPTAYDALGAAFAAGIDDRARFEALPYRDDVPTILTKLSHAHPPDGLEALEALRASDGTVVAVDDETAIEGSFRAGAADGLYLEPSSGVLVPAIERLTADGTIRPGATVVGLACGSGFRESFAILPRRPPSPERVALAALAAAVNGA